MSQEKLHDPFQWKNKLDDLDHLPGEAYTGKAAAWDKLQSRLQDKPRKTKVLSYWMAAASLLLVAGFTWFLIDQKDTATPQGQVRHTNENKFEKVIPVNDIKDTVVVANVKIDNKPAATAKRGKKQLQVSPVEDTVVEEQTPVNSEIVINPSPGIIVNNDHHPGTTEGIAAIPVKKKLKVVHINELQKPGEEEEWVRKVTGRDSYSGSLAQNHDHSGISISKNTSDNLLKIKLTPSN